MRLPNSNPNLNVAPRLILAPMEGLADDALRAVLTGTDAFDWCVTEFVRVTDSLLTLSHFTRICPELMNGARTDSGTPVRLQLLGASPQLMAANVALAATLDPFGIDLNFGCPSPQANRNRGGAALLEEPTLLNRIVTEVRAAVPPNLPVTAKLRLGIRNTEYTLDCARALMEGGASELVVHARTKEDGYRPPARWEWIARIRETVTIPVIATGEVWSVADYHAVRSASGCTDVMLGRGAVADPLLAARIQSGISCLETELDADWPRVRPLIAEFWQRTQTKIVPQHAPGRLKQWLGLMRYRYPSANALYADLRSLRLPAEVDQVLIRHDVSKDVITR